MDLIDLVTRPLGADRTLDLRGNRIIGCPVTQECPKVELPGLEQAGTELTVRSQAHAITVPAERLGDRGHDPDHPGSVEEPPPVRRRSTAGGYLLERVLGMDGTDDLVLADHLGAIPATLGIERHELDEANLDSALTPEAQAAFAKDVAALLEKEGVGLDLGSYRDAPPGLRIWCGATVEASDVAALMPWIEWAYQTVKAGLVKTA